jgi:hypothetical protein
MAKAEPLVMVDGLSVEVLVTSCHGFTGEDCLHRIKETFPKANSLALLRWLIYHQLIIPAK